MTPTGKRRCYCHTVGSRLSERCSANGPWRIVTERASSGCNRRPVPKLFQNYIFVYSINHTTVIHGSGLWVVGTQHSMCPNHICCVLLSQNRV